LRSVRRGRREARSRTACRCRWRFVHPADQERIGKLIVCWTQEYCRDEVFPQWQVVSGGEQLSRLSPAVLSHPSRIVVPRQYRQADRAQSEDLLAGFGPAACSAQSPRTIHPRRTGPDVERRRPGHQVANPSCTATARCRSSSVRKVSSPGSGARNSAVARCKQSAPRT